jgi:hypothetical protein
VATPAVVVSVVSTSVGGATSVGEAVSLVATPPAVVGAVVSALPVAPSLVSLLMSLLLVAGVSATVEVPPPSLAVSLLSPQPAARTIAATATTAPRRTC